MDMTPTPEAALETPESAAIMARYLRCWAVCLVLLLGFTAAFCAAVDPYAVLGTPGIAGLTARKPAAADWPRLTKPYTVGRAEPRTLVLGASSADIGLNPESPAWPQAARPVYNLGIDGALPSDVERFLHHALSLTHPAQIIIPVNFIESMVNAPVKSAPVTSGEFEFEARLRVTPAGTPNPAWWRGYANDLVFSTLSYTALSDSVRTLMSQHDSGATFETSLGWNDGGKFRRWAREDGFGGLFIDKNAEKISQWKRWLGWRKLQEKPVFDMIRAARAAGATPIVMIVPNHADILEALRALGLDQDYDGWKTRLVAGVAAIDRKIPVWDFSGYSPYTTEAVPPAGNHTQQLRWFYEPVHFQPALGDLMIARIEGEAPGSGFGVELTPENLPAHIADFHKAQAAWEATHKGDIARIAAIIATH